MNLYNCFISLSFLMFKEIFLIDKGDGEYPDFIECNRFRGNFQNLYDLRPFFFVVVCISNFHKIVDNKFFIVS